MSTVRDLHEQAMELAQAAYVARSRGRISEAVELSRRAYHLEVRAAEHIAKDRASEPTRSILYKSAASLASEAREYEIAERLVAEALAGFPPPDVRIELLHILESLTFQEHLRAQGLVLGTQQIWVSLLGEAVGFGRVIYREFKKRVDATVTMLDRTSRRKLGQPYQTQGPVPKALQAFQPVITAPSAGSFAVGIRLAVPENTTRSLFADEDEVISDVLTGVRYIEQDDIESLHSLIPDPAYFRNFLAAAKDLAPDGSEITWVGLSGANVEVSFTKTREEIKPPINAAVNDMIAPSVHVVIGILDYADAKKEIVRITPLSGSPVQVRVPEGLDDVVKSHWHETVRATLSAGFHDQRELLDIDPVADLPDVGDGAEGPD